MSGFVRLIFCSTALATAAGTGGGGDPVAWILSLIIVGIGGIVTAFLPISSVTSRSDKIALAGAILCPAYVALQLIPLPLRILQIVDPTRAEVTRALGGLSLGAGLSFAPLTIGPAKTWIHLSRFAGYALVFLTIRECARKTRRPWTAALPLLVIAGIEAALGLAQHSAANAAAPVSGTYYSKDHFAAILEMVLPFALLYGVAMLRGHKHERSPLVAPIQAFVVLSLAGVMFIALALSYCKMGYLSVIGSMSTISALAFGARQRGFMRWALVTSIVLITALMFIAVTPAHLAGMAVEAVSDPTAEGRLPIAKDTLHLIAAYPLLGSGLGTYFPALLPYQTASLNVSWVNAHNDYLELLAGLGIIGFTLLAVPVCVCVARAVRTALFNEDIDTRLLGLACTGGLAAILIHSFGDFNMYVPANAMVFAWITGISSSLPAPLGPTPAAWRFPNVSFLRRYAIALGCFLILYAGAWAVYLQYFQENVHREPFFCRFGVCNTEGVLNALQQKYGSAANMPPAELFKLLRRDPAGFYRWCDLGDALWEPGKDSDARFCFRRAQDLGPRMPYMLFRSARFYLNLGETGTGLKMAATSMEITPNFSEAIFNFYNYKGLTVPSVIKDGLPAVPRIWGLYLQYQIQEDRLKEALTLWNALVARGYADDKMTNEIVEYLIRKKNLVAAAEAWALYAHRRDEAYPDSNLVFNGDLELDPTGSRFDWTIEQPPGVTIDIDRQTTHSGSRSFRLQFDGKQNVGDIGVRQTVYLKHGRYRFSVYMRGKDISTDEGIRFRLTGDSASSRLNVTSEPVSGTTEWKLIQQVFDAPPGGGLVDVRLVRTPSLRFDNLIRGTLWVDQVSIRPGQ